jgi:hypothetical protein
VVIKVRLPANGWDPRPHQENLWGYLESGGKRAIAVWHRRAGKDEICLHHAAASAFKRIGNYWHCLPEYKQGHKAIWAAVNPHTGKRRIDEAFPLELRANTLDNEMFIRFKNGSTWQVIGSDRYDSTVGAGVVGITYSEFALSNPSAWAYHRPMLEENDGWAAFITTPRGRNHVFAMLNYARQTDGWFAELLTAVDTGSLTREQLNEALAEYMSLYGADAGRAAYEQEYMCSFTAAILGAFYALEKRHEERGWIHGNDYVPHDAKVKEWGSGRTRVETMSGMQLSPILVPLAGIQDGINAVRRTLPLCVFHPRCEPGLAAMEQYRREWDDELKAFRATPLHDWTSNYADAFRYLAQGWKPAAKRVIKVPEPEGWVLPPPIVARRGIRL